MKVLHVLSSNKFSGAENVACQIIEGMNRKSVESYYASPNGPIREVMKQRQISFIPLKTSSASEIKKAIKLVHPDIIHAHDMRASFCVSISCGKIPFISHIHNNNFNSQKLSVKSLLYLFAAKRAKHIFWVSKSSLNGYRFRNTIQDKSSVLYNVIDVDALRSKTEEDSKEYDYDCCFVGRITYAKNPERLLNVMEKMVSKNSNIRIAIIGSGDLDEKIKKNCVEKRLQKNIDFLGFLYNPYKILSQSKVLLMTSRWEGTPMCALEAMSLGVPIVSTPTDGLCDLVRNDCTGYLSNSDDELAMYCLKIIDDEKLHSRLSAQSYEFMIGTMRLEQYVDTIMKAYEDVIQKAKK